MEATQLNPVAERNPYRRIAVLGRRVVRMAANRNLVGSPDKPFHPKLFVDTRQVVRVGVAAGDVGEIVLLGVAAGSRGNQRLFAVTPAGHGEVVGNAILVDVAEVIREHPFLREHRLDVDRHVGLVSGRVSRQVRRDRNRLRQGLLRRDRKRPFRRGAFLLRGRDEPGVQEAVLYFVTIAVVARGFFCGRRGDARAGVVEGNVHLAVQPAVVDGVGAIAPRIDIDSRSRRAVPVHAEERSVGECRALCVQVAFAATALCISLYVLLRKRTVAEADRTVGNRNEELGRLDSVHVRPGKEPLILVFDGKHDVYVTLHTAEVRDERAAPLVRIGHVEGRRVLAALESHLDARTLAVRPLVGEVALDVAAYRPVDRIRSRRAASDAPGVRVL